MSLIAERELSTLEPREMDVSGRLHSLFSAIAAAPLAQVAGKVGVCSFLAMLFVRHFYVSDPDIWWHLATGRWILQHHALPMTDPFSSYGLGKPWIVYSWMFDVIVQLLYRPFGYAAIAYFEVLIRVVLAVALFHLVQSLLPHFWRAAVITAVSLYAMSWVIGPRPGMLTIRVKYSSVRAANGCGEETLVVAAPVCNLGELAYSICVRVAAPGGVCVRGPG